MDVIQKSEAIKAGLWKGFQDSSSKMAHRKCYGYDVGPDGELAMNPNEARVVRWIFEQYLAGNSLRKIVADLEKQGIFFPAGKPRWNREAIVWLLFPFLTEPKFFILSFFVVYTNFCAASADFAALGAAEFLPLYCCADLIRNNGRMGSGIEIPFHEAIIFNLNCASADRFLEYYSPSIFLLESSLSRRSRIK